MLDGKTLLIRITSYNVCYTKLLRQTPDSEVAKMVQKFADSVNDSDSGLEVQVYPSGVLGSERDVIELVKNGDLDMAKVGA